MAQPPHIHILLASYQGATHLEAQLTSIAAQTHRDWRLTVSDDGSTDSTVAIARAFAERHTDHRIRVIAGPGQQSTANFFHLLHHAEPSNPSDCFAFCDQDDVWLPHKLQRAATHLQSVNASGPRPQLYAARTRWVNESLQPLALSPLPKRPLGFGNALLQNVVSGNTLVFNAALWRLLRMVRAEHAVWHDWVAYLAATGCGGQVHFDPEPCLLYRQHAQNQVGGQGGSWNQLRRLGLLAQGQYRAWGDQTEAAAQDLAPHLTEAARQLLHQFSHMRRQTWFWQRCWAYHRSGLWRQTRSGRASLWLGLLLNRI